MKRLLCIVLAVMLLGGCTAPEKKTQQTVFCMDTVMDVQLWGEDAEIGTARVISQLTTLEKHWSATDPEAVLYQLNHGNNQYQWNAEEIALLAEIEALSARTGGAFDPKLRAVVELWNFTAEDPAVPTGGQIAAALRESQWDLGGALKGYAGRECVRLLSELEIHRAILNLGGNVQTFGEKPDGTPWQIAIQNPNGGGHLGVVSVTGTMAVVTSGDYQRYFELNGVRYHHILNPETGYPADTGLSSVTVISQDGLVADALSTALFVMGLAAGTELWRQSGDFEAVFVLKDGSIAATEGVALSGCKYEVIRREN